MHVIFAFYNDAATFRSWVSPPDFKHVQMLMYDGDRWVWFDYGDDGIKYRIFKECNAGALIRGVRRHPNCTHLVAIEMGERKQYRWWPWCINTCQQMMQRFVGLDLPWSVTPYGMYKKLIKYDGRTNFTILNKWSRYEPSGILPSGPCDRQSDSTKSSRA